MSHHNDNHRAGGPDPLAERNATAWAGAAANPQPSKRIDAECADGAPVLVRLSDVKPQAVKWLWPGRVPSGRLTVLVGCPGGGKSFTTADWSARVSTGRAWPDGAACRRGSVVLVSAEDDPGDTIRPRLDAHGADVDRIHLLQGVQRIGPGGKLHEAAFTLADLPALEETLKRVGDPALVIIDPIGSYIGGRVDAHRDNEVRAVLAPLGALAQRYDVAVVLVAHNRKGGALHADDLVLGSRAFTALARSVLHLMREPENEERRLLLPGKCNLSAPAPALAFTIEGNPPRLAWEPEPVDITADKLLAAAAGAGNGGGPLEEAKEWLRDVLSDGPAAAADVKEWAERDGIKPRTLDRAKTALGIKPTREGYGSKGRWVWPPPHSAPTQPKDAKGQSVAHNGKIGAESPAGDGWGEVGP